MAEKIYTFAECIENSKEKRHLILGNGFSMDIFPDIFNYRKLAERITDQDIKNLFDEFKTSDFEFVMSRLAETLRVLEYYDKKKDISPTIDADAAKLKKILISVISESHPEFPAKITDDQYLHCNAFLTHFELGKKYTFNYDLILYWTYMHFLNHQDCPLKCDDGFRYDEDDHSTVVWEIGREFEQNLYYLHGSMHIFKDKHGTIEKYRWNQAAGKTIGDQVRESIEANKFPVFISEGSTEHKLKRIKGNGYLARSFSSLRNIRDDLFIFGHSVRDEDDHVFNIMNKNKGLKRIFIGLFDPSSDDSTRIIEKVKRWRQDYTSSGREYIFYETTSAKVWRD